MIDYNIDWERWFRLMLPLSLRRPLLVALLVTLIRPLASLYAWWRSTRADDLEHLETTGQVCYLRGALQRHLPSVLGIPYRVETAPRTLRMGYARAETSRDLVRASRQTAPRAVAEADQQRGHNRILIYVPQDIYQTRLHEVIALVERYKLPSKQVDYYPISNL